MEVPKSRVPPWGAGPELSRGGMHGYHGAAREQRVAADASLQPVTALGAENRILGGEE